MVDSIIVVRITVDRCIVDRATAATAFMWPNNRARFSMMLIVIPLTRDFTRRDVAGCKCKPPSSTTPRISRRRLRDAASHVPVQNSVKGCPLTAVSRAADYFSHAGLTAKADSLTVLAAAQVAGW